MMRSHRRLHARIWLAIALLLPLGIVISLLAGSRLAADAPAVRLDQPAGSKP